MASATANTIESLLSARLFVEPQLAGDTLFYLSNLSGHLSLYAMGVGGEVPSPLLPPRIALQNPELMAGKSFRVVPELGMVVVMIDADGDERYRPFRIPLQGGFPEPLAAESFVDHRSHLLDVADGFGYLVAESTQESMFHALRVDLRCDAVTELGRSAYGAFPVAWTPDHARVFLLDEYLAGDCVLSETGPSGNRRILYGTPLDERESGTEYPAAAIRSPHGTASGDGLLLVAGLFDDAGAPAFLDFARPGEIEPVAVQRSVHHGAGELEELEHLAGDRYALQYNIDGCTWVYEATFAEDARALTVERVLVGEGELGGGVAQGFHFDAASGRLAVSFCTATGPTQLYVLEGKSAAAPARRTRERVLGLEPGLLAAGEDASFESYDGLRVSARLYLPAERLGYEGPRPLVYYVHGGPQGQERPNFAWFSMPLIQILTLQGFVVFVPNVRGSTGYGLHYMKRVDRDWGGQDRLDHVFAITEVLPKDERIDASRAGVVGRSYGGYMTLMLAGRHPGLWRAAVDMFGPYDLATFFERIPVTWKPYFALALGDPERDRDFFVERSPRTYAGEISCPLLVIQGRNDPRVVESESADLVEELRAAGRDVDYLVFGDEGHDVLKLENRVRCYEAIAGFFSRHLVPD